MARCVLVRWSFAVLIAGLVSACSGSKSASTAPAPATSREGTSASAEPAKPVARGLTYPASEGFMLALSRGTRTRTGQPGPHYWQQWADYSLQAELNPVSKRMTGKGTIKYFNRSPDTLRVVYVQLLQNIYAPNARHDTNVPWSVEGIGLNRVAAQGVDLTASGGEGPGYEVGGTVMRIRLPQPLVPGGTADFAFDWKLRVPPDGAPRGGQDGEVYFMNYWYPQMAVYDDINGWQVDQYLGNGEFYMGYGNYDVSLTVPAGWLVTATGTLQNPDDVLTARTRARLDSARAGHGIVHVVTDVDREPGRSTTAGTGGKLTWRFHADNVRDVAWASSARYVWDATTAAVGDAKGDGKQDTTLIQAFWRPEQRVNHWDESARYSQYSIEFYSKYLWPYPYPHMTAVDGPNSCGGMEYPMMTCIGGQWDTLGMYEVTTHEIGHMWFPMIVGSDEKRFAWMDEGLTQFDQSQSMDDFFKGFDDEARNRRNYLDFSSVGDEVELMHHADRFPSYGSYGVAAYYKPATVLVALRGVLGRDLFHKAFVEYGRRWQYKHPSPWDFFATFEDVSGRDLSWFWRTWFFETWRLDQAIDSVAPAGDSLDVEIENRGKAPMPVPLVVTRTDGHVDTVTVPVDVWLTGAKRTHVKVAKEPPVKSIEIDPGHEFPDVERDSQRWPR